jgi:hypothetical protein
VNASDADAPKETDSDAPMTHSAKNDSPKAENLKVYEWAATWGCRPRQVIEVARRLNIRVQNRLTRLSPTNAHRILTDIESASADSESA